MPNNTHLSEDFLETLASRSHPLEVRPSGLPPGAFEAFMETVGYGGPDPAYSARCRAETLRDRDSDWDPVHGIFMYLPDATLLAVSEDYRNEPNAWAWVDQKWTAQPKTVAWLANAVDLSV